MMAADARPVGTRPPRALMVIGHDIEPDRRREYIRWHTFEHLPERLALPGFGPARRFERLEGPGNDIVCLIDLAQPDAALSPAYLERLNNPTEWTRRVMPWYRSVDRGIYRVLAGSRTGFAHLGLFIRLHLDENDADGHAASLADAADPDICELLVARRDVSVSKAPSREAHLRDDVARQGSDVLVIATAATEEPLRALADLCLQDRPHVRADAPSMYGMQYIATGDCRHAGE